MSFASWLSEKMSERHMNQSELAERLGVTRGAINNLLSGRSKTPSVETIEKLARALDVTPEDIMRRVGMLPEASQPDQWTLETQRKIAKLKTPRYKKIVLSLIETLSQQEQEELSGKKQ